MPSNLGAVRIGIFWLSVFLTWVVAQDTLPGAEPSKTISSAQRRASRNIFGYDPTPDFIKFDADYLQKHATYAAQLSQLQLELARQTSKGRPTPCSRQIFLEARWLVFYSAHWDEIERRLADLRETLGQPSDPPSAREQIEADGSYDHCSHTWFLKVDSTIEEVENRGERGEKPKYPLKLLERINSPDKLKSYLDSLLLSAPGTLETTSLSSRTVSLSCGTKAPPQAAFCSITKPSFQAKAWNRTFCCEIATSSSFHSRVRMNERFSDSLLRNGSSSFTEHVRSCDYGPTRCMRVTIRIWRF